MYTFTTIQSIIPEENAYSQMFNNATLYIGKDGQVIATLNEEDIKDMLKALGIRRYE